MLTKQQKYLQRLWIKHGSIDMRNAARHLGYKGQAMTKGMEHVRDIMKRMHIPGYSA